MISDIDLRRLEQLQLSASRRLSGSIAGEHRSQRHGETLDFADFREYHPGDDVRRVDTNMLARHDVLRVKLFEADDDLTVRILLDTSGSMGMYNKDVTARDLVTALGVVTLTSGDAVRLLSFPGSTTPRRFAGRQGLAELIAHLHDVRFGGESPFVEAARAALGQPGPPGLTLVISDLLTPDWQRAVERLPSRGADLVVVHVLAREETDPQLIGDLSLIDEESLEWLPVSLSEQRLVTYRERVAAWRGEVRRRCREVGGRYLPVDAGDSVVDLLLATWRAHGVLR